MKSPQGFARSKGSQGSVSKKVFLAKKKKKENILGSHLRESKLTHIRMMCSPHMHSKTTTTFFYNCHKSEKCFNFGKKCFACQLVQFRGFPISYAAKVPSVKKRFQSVVIFIPIFSITWSSLRIVKWWFLWFILIVGNRKIGKILLLFVLSIEVNGGWNQWSEWSFCTKSMDGLQTRSRDCVNPKPKYGGDRCHGTRVVVRKCGNTQTCQNSKLIIFSFGYILQSF